MARRTVLVCDNCGKEVGENKGAGMRITFTDARRGSKVADLCDSCAASYPGRAAAPRAPAEVRRRLEVFRRHGNRAPSGTRGGRSRLPSERRTTMARCR